MAVWKIVESLVENVRDSTFLADVPDRLTAGEFWGLFGEVEHETLDFKGGPGDSFKELIPAMAMTDGGLAILGVSDTDDVREIAGCRLSQRT